MVLDNNECSIDGDKITISKAALEKWRRHYSRVAAEREQVLQFLNGYYLGKADVFVDLLKHFEEENI